MQEDLSKDINISRVEMPKIMLGTFQVKNYEQMYTMVKTAFENGCYAFDTSPSYGTEKYLGRALAENIGKTVNREKVFVSTKIDGIQMYKTNGNIEEYVYKSLENLQLDYIDLLLIHWPFEKYIENTWDTMENLYQTGIVKAIGICNVNKRVLDKLIKQRIFKKIFPHVVQNEISPLRTCNEEIKYYKENKIKIQAYSPLARMIKPIKDSEVLRELSQKYKKDIGQIILRWHIDRGIVPIFTSTKPERIKSNLNIFDFSLKKEDIDLINELNQDYKIFLESYGCPGI